MCEKCEYQSLAGKCQNVRSENFNEFCPGVTMKADVRDCEFSKVVPCENNKCQKCER